ncbi:MAG: hypothetical protein ACI8V5_003818, partial [Limisphaerales bacterium]
SAISASQPKHRLRTLPTSRAPRAIPPDRSIIWRAQAPAMEKLRKALGLARDGWTIVGVTLVVFLALECLA